MTSKTLTHVPESIREFFPDSEIIGPPGSDSRSESQPGGSIFISGTHSDTLGGLYSLQQPSGPHWAVKVTDFGGDVMELHALYRERAFPRRTHKREKRSETREDMQERDIIRSGMRARTRARKAIVNMRADTMMTLTYQECVTDLDRAWSDWAKFRRILQRRYRWARNFVLVYELQSRGAIHFHVALRTSGAWLPYMTLIKLWRRVIGGGGSVNFRRDFNYRARQVPARIAGYLSKYLNKSFESGEVGRKRYDVARGMSKPVELVIYLPVGDDTPLRLSHLLQTMVRRRPSLSLDFPGAIYMRTY